jgi:hypothetical protein
VSKRTIFAIFPVKGDHVVFKRFSILDIGFGVTMILFGTGSGALLFSMAYRIAKGGACDF